MNDDPMEPVEYDELASLAGLIEPAVVDEPDGFYDRRIVIDRLPAAGPVSEASALPSDAMEWHYEPCKVPRFKKVLRWIRGPHA